MNQMLAKLAGLGAFKDKAMMTPGGGASPAATSEHCALRSAIDMLGDSYRQYPVPELERAIIDLRIAAFREFQWPAPAVVPAPGKAPVPNGQLAEIHARDLSAQVLQDAVAGGGGLIVRELMEPAFAERMTELIDAALEVRRDLHDGVDVGERNRHFSRPKSVTGGPQQFKFKSEAERNGTTGSMWAVDSPPAACAMLEFYTQLGLPALMRECFGEEGVLSVRKWVLRKAAPKPAGLAGWHQDGRFLGEGIRSINLWVALSHCGADASAPGMEIVADHRKRIHETGTRGAYFDWVVGPELVKELAANTPVLEPEFFPGDGLFFDHFNLHRTQCSTRQTDCRYAVESWFFAASNAPVKTTPLVL
ncbi:MAG: hypothetical protein AAF756_21875 [Pseudomonadota bacterium]